MHYGLDLWFTKVVRAHWRGEALLYRLADDWVCAFRSQEEAERFYRVLPKRREKFNLQVAPEKTRLRRFRRFHPSMKRRFTFLGFEFAWRPDRQGVPRLKRRTARKELQAACRRMTAWIKQHRHLPGREFFRQLHVRLQEHDNYYGVRGNVHSLQRFFRWESVSVLADNAEPRHSCVNRYGVLDTGSTVNMLPYPLGLQLGFVWEQ